MHLLFDMNLNPVPTEVMEKRPIDCSKLSVVSFEQIQREHLT